MKFEIETEYNDWDHWSTRSLANDISDAIQDALRKMLKQSPELHGIKAVRIEKINVIQCNGGGAKQYVDKSLRKYLD
jgi:hypothetical protein